MNVTFLLNFYIYVQFETFEDHDSNCKKVFNAEFLANIYITWMNVTFLLNFYYMFNLKINDAKRFSMMIEHI